VITPSLHFERQYEFGSSIVWDALVDAELVSGWLAEATITPGLGGQYTLRWLNRDTQPCSEGHITRFDPQQVLEVESEVNGTLVFTLSEVVGGSRGMSTILAVDLLAPIERVFAARVKADWLTNLDQLADLLRGHPVDWENWERDRAEAWAEYLDEMDTDPARHQPR
jgi:Activator of Hsp90 ATPase homolog 1-like protein